MIERITKVIPAFLLSLGVTFITIGSFQGNAICGGIGVGLFVFGTILA